MLTPSSPTNLSTNIFWFEVFTTERHSKTEAITNVLISRSCQWVQKHGHSATALPHSSLGINKFHFVNPLIFRRLSA